MYEVEIKVPATLDTVRARLEALDATSRGRVVQTDTYYDAPHRSFGETDEALRIREERLETDDAGASTRADDGGDSNALETTLTYKGPLIDAASKTREEHETKLADGTAMRRALESLGFEPAATVRKERERYGLDGLTVTLDRVDGVGEFVEVETEAETEAAIDDRREAALAILEQLELEADEQLRTSYLELTLEG